MFGGFRKLFVSNRKLTDKWSAWMSSKSKKDKIVKIVRKETLEDQLLKAKKEDLKVASNTIIGKNKKTINSLSFDELTLRMKQESIAITQLRKEHTIRQNTNEINPDESVNVQIGDKITLSNTDKLETIEMNDEDKNNEDGVIRDVKELRILVTERERYVDFSTLEFPWDFQGKQIRQQEGNLKSAVEVAKIIEEKSAISLFKTFVSGLEEYDYEGLSEIVERKFLRQLSKRLQPMQQEGITLKSQNVRTKDIVVDLFKVSNVFGVGVEQNRRKNNGASSYMIFDDFIKAEVPAKHIVKKRIEPGELARIFVQLHLTFESNISLTLFNPKTETSRSDMIAKGLADKQIHTMVIEKIIVECDYKSIRNKALATGASSLDYVKSNINDYMHIANMKNLTSTSNFKIIDFDGFMAGNPLVTDSLDFD